MFLLTLEEIKEFMANMSITLNLGVYRIFVYAYEIFLKLFSSRIIYNVEYREIINRIYTIIGMVMLFVIAYNILVIIIEPERNKGGKSIEKMIRKIVVTIILIILSPSIFNWGFKLQNEIFNGNYIYNIFSGKNFNKTNVQNAAAMAAGDVLSAFFYSESGLDDEKITAASANTATYVLAGNNTSCSSNNSCPLSTAKMIAHNGQYSVFRSFAKNIDLNDQNKIDFPWIIALITGLYLAYIMVGFCIGLMIRIIKLALYEIMAPIALSLGVIPSKEDLTKVWASSVIKTYLSLFIHMFAVYLSVYLLSLIPYNVGPFNCTAETCSFGVRNFSYAIYAIAIFTFMKSAPKLIDGLFGLNSNMHFSIKDLFKKSDNDKKVPISINTKNSDRTTSNNIKTQSMYGKTNSKNQANMDAKNNLYARSKATVGMMAQASRLNVAGQSFSMMNSGVRSNTSSKKEAETTTTGHSSYESAVHANNAAIQTFASSSNSRVKAEHVDSKIDGLYSGTSSNQSVSQPISINSQGSSDVQLRTATKGISNTSTSGTSGEKNKMPNINITNNYSAHDNQNDKKTDSETKAKKIDYEAYIEKNNSKADSSSQYKGEKTHQSTITSNQSNSSNNKNNQANTDNKQTNNNKKDDNLFTIATTKKTQNIINGLMNNNTRTSEPESLDVVPKKESSSSQHISIKKYKTYKTKTLDGEVEIPLTPGIYCDLADAYEQVKDNNEVIDATIHFEDDFGVLVNLTLKYNKELLKSEIDNYLDLV